MSGTVTVQAPCGPVTGIQSRPVDLFAGIPFAAPPVGGLRFQAPQRIPDGTAELDATSYPPAPVQGSGSLSSGLESVPAGQQAPNGEQTQAGAAGLPGDGLLARLSAQAREVGFATSEDCLYLNVWTPDPGGRRPVLVWFFGGGFDSGSASPPNTDAAGLAARADVVVVAANYRLGALGFGYWAGLGGDSWLPASNLGLQDQAAALRWVRRNIEAFGGDRDNITVAGQSAGAFGVGALLGMPLARQLFDKAILHSGSTHRVFPKATGDRIARDLFDALSISTMDELRDTAPGEIAVAQDTVVDTDIGARNLPGGRAWGVVLDGVVIPRAPHDALRRGLARHIPLLIGANRDEVSGMRTFLGSSFAPRNESELLAELAKASVADPGQLLRAYRSRAASAGRSAELAGLRAEFLTDFIYRRPAGAMAAAQEAAGGRAWNYLFSAGPFGADLGAFHAADLLFTFDHLAAIGIDTPGNLAVRDAVIEAWGAFCRNGDPGWERYGAHSARNTRQFGGKPDFIAEPAADPVLEAWPADQP